MGMPLAAANAFLLHLFNNQNWATVGDATGLLASATTGSVYVALHTADPGTGGNQSTSETTYTGYARVAVARTSGGWTITANAVSNTAQVQFPQCSGGSSTVTYFSVGTASSGASQILFTGALASSLAISNGITPLFAAGQITDTVT